MRLFKPEHAKTNKLICAPSEDSDQSRRLPSLIRAFAGQDATLHVDSDDAIQTR